PLGTGRMLTVTLPLGPHVIALRVSDPEGASDTSVAGVTVRDTAPPTLSLAVDRAVLWPPNHRMVPVHVSWHAEDRCDPTPAIATQALVQVSGPHDQGSGPEPILMSVAPRGSGGAVSLSWTPVPGALSYDVIAGDLQQIKVFPSMLSLGQVTVLAAGMQRTT